MQQAIDRLIVIAMTHITRSSSPHYTQLPSWTAVGSWKRGSPSLAVAVHGITPGKFWKFLVQNGARLGKIALCFDSKQSAYPNAIFPCVFLLSLLQLPGPSTLLSACPNPAGGPEHRCISCSINFRGGAPVTCHFCDTVSPWDVFCVM